MRANNGLPMERLLSELRPDGTFKTYASWKVWSGSIASDVKFGELPRKRAAKIYHRARAWNRQKTAGRYGGALGSAALRVLESLVFDFLNFKTGRLDPSYETIARKTGLGRSTVAVALARLKALRIVSWLRRCVDEPDARGGYRKRQVTNAYAVLPHSQWLGYEEPAEAPPADPASWGAVPPLPPLLDLALEAGRSNKHGHALALLETDPNPDPLDAVLASLGRALRARQPHVFTGVQSPE